MDSYKDLFVYKKSYEAALEIYKLVNKSMPREEVYGLTSQIRRASTSIPLNIAEGYAKNSGNAETARFLSMAKGSSAEMEVLTDFLKDLGYITEEEHRSFAERYTEIGKMLTGLIKSVKTVTTRN